MDSQTPAQAPAKAPDNALVRFLRSKAAIPVGFVIALAIGVFLMIRGFCCSDVCCGLGPLLIAVLMFFIVKLFNGKSTKLLVCFGVLFFVVATVIGAFAFSAPNIDQNQDYNNYESDNFKDLVIDYNKDESSVTVTITYVGEQPTIYVNFKPMAWTCYNYSVYYADEKYTHDMTPQGDGKYTATFSVDSGNAYVVNFISKSADKAEIESSRNVIFTTDGFNTTTFCLKWNAYYSCIPAIIFILIAFITLWLRKRLEKERKKMEADGRLYPEGYGRCKECGSIVLPGEVSCRKCGAYIDVPDNMRVKKADSFQCSECGAEVPGDATMCPKCGAKFDDDTETVIVEKGKEDNTKDSFQCSDCGATVPGNATVCPNCGAKFDEDDESNSGLRKCPNCGTEVPDYANNCHKCGTKLDKKR